VDIPTLETKRLKLRAFTLADWAPYSAMHADAAFARYLGGKPLSRQEVWEEIAVILGHWRLLGYGLWALECRRTGELVGRAGLLNPPGWPDVEVCWALAPGFWGQGFATEAARAAVQWAFECAGLDRVISLIHPDNLASEAVARRLGETFRERIDFEGKPTNVYELGAPARA
jgi:[ribosomal protein S5]-alanine N-acetyltransferase